MTSTNPSPTVRLDLTLAQAAAMSLALECYARLGIGQFEEIANLVSMGTVPCFTKAAGPRQSASLEQAERIGSLAGAIKHELGYPPNGSHGIGHANNHITVKRAWEIRKVVDKVLAEHRDPNPEFRGVNYDGLVVRYTEDSAPLAAITPAAPDWLERAAGIAMQLLDGPLQGVTAQRSPDGRGMPHLRWMAEQLAGQALSSETKACRWLGYLQGALVERGHSTLEAEKARNLASGRDGGGSAEVSA